RDPDWEIITASVAIALKPDNRDAYLSRGRAWLEKDPADPARTIADATAVLRLQPDTVGAYELRALAYEMKGQLDLAIANPNEGIAPRPDDYRTRIERANDYMAAARTREAMADYDTAVRLAPADWAVFSFRCIASATLGDAAPAKADCDKAVELGPD